MASPIGIEYLKSEGGGDIQFSFVVHGHSICATYVSVRWGMHVKVGLTMGERTVRLSKVVGSFHRFARLIPAWITIRRACFAVSYWLGTYTK